MCDFKQKTRCVFFRFFFNHFLDHPLNIQCPRCHVARWSSWSLASPGPLVPRWISCPSCSRKIARPPAASLLEGDHDVEGWFGVPISFLWMLVWRKWTSSWSFLFGCVICFFCCWGGFEMLIYWFVGKLWWRSNSFFVDENGDDDTTNMLFHRKIHIKEKESIKKK